jgi:23S rRNA (adenine2503-C2)-methyltransferase
MLPEDLAEHLRGLGVGVRDGECRRIVAHAISLGRDGFPVERPVPGRVMDAVQATVDRTRLAIVDRATDPGDGFMKYLFQAQDGAEFEAVRIPLERSGAFTVCLSSQAGCGLGCAFCATGRMGLTRNLDAWEIVSSLMSIRDEAPGRITGAVFMGQGEPFANREAVLKAARILSDPCGGRISADAISISTVGLPGAIQDYARSGHRYRLIVSLTSAIQERREALIPAARAFPLKALAEELREYAAACRDRITIAWVVVAGVNTGDDEIDALVGLLGDLPLRINLIEVNDARPDGFARPSYQELDDFRKRLGARGFPVVRRYSGGAATHAACGMLASMRRLEN